MICYVSYKKKKDFLANYVLGMVGVHELIPKNWRGTVVSKIVVAVVLCTRVQQFFFLAL
jgi:hypothetical protein